MRLSKRIISLFVAFATIISLFCVPAHAASDDENISFWTWLDNSRHANTNYFAHFFDDDICAHSPDVNGHHKFVQQHTQVNGKVGDFYICEYCGREAGEVAEAAYQEEVRSMPYQGITSDGGFIWQPTFNDLSSSYPISVFRNGYSKFTDFPKNSLLNGDYDTYNDYCFDCDCKGDNSGSSGFCLVLYIIVPFDGYYSIMNSSPLYNGYLFNSSNYGSPHLYSFYYDISDSSELKIKGNSINVDFEDWNVSTWYGFRGRIYLPLFRVTPDTAPSGMTADSRPVSISAPLIYTDNSGQTKTTETTIINETDKSVYNPVTGDTTTYDSWDYDYSTRTYTFKLAGDSSETTTVTYGDENLTIVEGSTTYNINYYMDPSGGGDTPAPEPGHKHNYTSEVTREATCTTAGIETYTCAECGNTYTKAIPSLGHDWVIKEQIPTAYDESGDVVTQGYTIYRCSRCGEEYKSTDGKPPESGGKDGSSLWDKIGELLGTVGGGLFGLIGQFLSSILDVLISLAEQIGEKLKTIVEMVLGWFDEVPKLFAGFLGFLTAVFPFLPAEAMMLLTFGIAAVVFISIIKALRRR